MKDYCIGTKIRHANVKRSRSLDGTVSKRAGEKRKKTSKQKYLTPYYEQVKEIFLNLPEIEY